MRTSVRFLVQENVFSCCSVSWWTEASDPSRISRLSFSCCSLSSWDFRDCSDPTPREMLRCPPLKERVYRSSCIGSMPTTNSICARTSTYKDWAPFQMDKAVTAVVNEGLSIRRAALQYGVPKSSLGDRISGRVKPGAVSGPQKYLSTEEENELVRHLSRCASIGYAKSRKEVLTLVQRIIDSRGIQRNVSSGWWESFCRRHPSLTLRTAVPLSLTRAKASDPEMLSRYFDLLEKTMEENHLTGKPGQIFNMDESGMPLDPKPQR